VGIQVHPTGAQLTILLHWLPAMMRVLFLAGNAIAAANSTPDVESVMPGGQSYMVFTHPLTSQQSTSVCISMPEIIRDR
jgi:hypothetical protein